MSSNAKKKIAIFITLGMIFALSLIIINIYNFNTGNSENSTDYNVDYNLDYKNLKISAVSEKIHIDNNWTAAKAAEICTGNGIYSDPYVIEDLVIDGGGSGSCILIENSDVYFRIENCTVYNSGGYLNAGIELSNVINSLIITNNCSSNYDGIYLSSSDDNIVSGNVANSNKNNGIYVNGGYNNTFSGNNASYNKRSGISLPYSDYNFLLGNTVKNNIYFGVLLVDSRNNIIKGNFVINNDVGIYIQYSLHYSNNFQGAGNEISDNIYIGNNQDIREVTNDVYDPFIALIIFLSIATVVIVITSLTIELITKRSYPREDEKYQLPIYGISAVVVESAGALLFIMGAIFLNPAVFVYSLFWRLILLPFAVGGIIISRVGLKKDIKKYLAGLGIGFGILLLILNAQLMWLTNLFAVALIIVIAAVVIGIFLVWEFQKEKKKSKRIPR